MRSKVLIGSPVRKKINKPVLVDAPVAATHRGSDGVSGGAVVSVIITMVRHHTGGP